MEFQEVVARRRMVRHYTKEPVPRAALDAIIANLQRGPSAGYSQGFGFLVLDDASDIARFRDAATPATDSGNWFAATFDAPLVVIACSNKRAPISNGTRSPTRGSSTARTPGGQRPTGTSTPDSRRYWPF
ncbi:MAG TPA: nitroreductase family protein [Acidimicrobiales bacterium]|nr:nitroreductase family protein [Acidimicrobiales bacterium]